MTAAREALGRGRVAHRPGRAGAVDGTQRCSTWWSATRRSSRSWRARRRAAGARSHGGGPYADAAVEFLALALRLARPDGGRVGLVLPTSIVATRDAADVRRSVLDDGALTWFWWSPARSSTPRCARARSPSYAASTGGCARPAEIRRHDRAVLRARGGDPDQPSSSGRPPQVGDRGRCSVHERRGPSAAARPLACGSGVLGDLATVKADFRDEYYGLVGAVSDDVDAGGAPRHERPDRSGPLPVGPAPDPLRQAALRRAPGASSTALAAGASSVGDRAARAEGARRQPDEGDRGGRRPGRIAWLPCVPVVSVIPRQPGRRLA